MPKEELELDDLVVKEEPAEEAQAEAPEEEVAEPAAEEEAVKEEAPDFEGAAEEEQGPSPIGARPSSFRRPGATTRRATSSTPSAR